jgi:hypothetical protein
MSRKLLAIGLVAVVALSAGACSSSGSATSSAPAGHAGGTATTSTKTTSSGGRTAEIDACSLLPVAQASTLSGKKLTSAKSSTIATGQDQCDYGESGSVIGVVVIIYQPNSGVSLAMMSAVLGSPTPVSGVGDKAIGGDIELDVQTGNRLIAIQGAGGNGRGGFDRAIAVAKAIIAALH